MPHFELTNETQTNPKGKTLHRIRATKDLPHHGVHKGDLGGYIQHKSNLRDEAWVADNARAWGRAIIEGKALLANNACAYDDARISDNATARENVVISDSTPYGSGYLSAQRTDLVSCTII